MALSVEDGALAIYEILFGDRDAERERKNNAECGMMNEEGGCVLFPSHRSSLIREGVKKKRCRCRICRRIGPNAGRGLCGRCYYHVRKAERG